ncbi:hypothetical protein TNCV_499991 [Trichonephila clavipes]|nr:hypothetical protein TNCV_499991 [Trichonephila clavipes]
MARIQIGNLLRNYRIIPTQFRLSGLDLPELRSHNNRLGGVVGLLLVFYTEGYGFDPGLSRWIFMMWKTNSGHVV